MLSPSRVFTACLLLCAATSAAFPTLLTAAATEQLANLDEAPSVISRTGGNKDKWSTLAQLQKAADADNPAACLELGEMHLEGTDVPKDLPRALALFEKAADAKSARAAFRLGKLYADGELVTQDFAKALAYYQTAARLGSSEGQHNIGAMHASGRGVPRNYGEGLAWLIVARQNGADGDSETLLREKLIRSGRSAVVTSAELRATAILKELAEAPPPPPPTANARPARPAFHKGEVKVAPVISAPAPQIPQLDRAFLHPEPPETGPSIKLISATGQRQIIWKNLATLERAAADGQPLACADLGQILLQGDTVTKDPLRAISLLEKSAAAGTCDAAYLLADLYANGTLAPRDDKKAFTYYLQAAKGGAAIAMFNTGSFLISGRGTAKDYTEALAWLTVAKRCGVNRGTHERIRANLTKSAPLELAKADARIAEIIKALPSYVPVSKE